MAYDEVALRFAFKSGAIACEIDDHPKDHTPDEHEAWLEEKFLKWLEEYHNLQRALRGGSGN